jgi:hypothetical protein
MVRQQASRWSQPVPETNRALELEEGVFTWNDPRRIALSLKRSADARDQRKSPPFRSGLAWCTSEPDG